jgi:hypothetical protein
VATPRPPRWPKRWWLWLVAASVVVLGVPLLTLRMGNDAPDLPPRTVEDQEFVREANDTCRRVLVPLREERPQRDGDRQLRNEAALASRIDRTADGLSQLTAELRRLPLAVDDQADVNRWLDDWDGYAAVGHRYAEALRRQDEDSYRSITDEGTELGKRVWAFARANGMADCTP